VSARDAAIERGRRAYNTRYRQLQAVRRHLIGMGVPEVTYVGKGYDRRITIPGLNVHVRTNIRRDFAKKGRTHVLSEMTRESPLPLVIFEVPTYAEDPEEVLVTMPINTLIHLLRR
jgi:hypothetical protein